MKLTATKHGIKLVKPKVRRESFLPSDKEWIDKNSNIEPNEFVNDGTRGSIYTVKGNKNLILKVPRDFNDAKNEDQLDSRQRYVRDNLFEEIEIVNTFGSNELFIPSKAIAITNKHGFKVPAIVRPRIKAIIDPTTLTPVGLKDLTDAEIEQLRQKVISLSEKGITIRDGLQVGRDRKGRIQLYDMGYVEKHSISLAFSLNAGEWIFFLRRAGRYTRNSENTLKKYGKISRR